MGYDHEFSNKWSRSKAWKHPITWLSRGFSEEESVRRSELFMENQRKKSKRCVEYWISLGYSEAEATEIISKKNGEYYRLRGPLKPESTFLCVEYYTSRGYTEQEAVEIIRNRQDTTSEESFRSRYGVEEGSRLYREYWDKISSQRKFPALVERYGLESAIERLEKRRCKASVSNASQMFFQRLLQSLDESGIDYGSFYYEYGKGTRERYYFYDLCFSQRKLVIEYHGDYWHANPNIYEETWVHPVTKKTAKEIWEYDETKISTIRNLGFDVVIVWESDDEDVAIQDIMRKLNENR